MKNFQKLINATIKNKSGFSVSFYFDAEGFLGTGRKGWRFKIESSELIDFPFEFESKLFGVKNPEKCLEACGKKIGELLKS